MAPLPVATPLPPAVPPMPPPPSRWRAGTGLGGACLARDSAKIIAAMLPAERCSLKGGDARDDGVVGVLPPAACASVPEGGVGAHVTPAARLATELCSVLTELVTELTAAPAFLCS